MADYKVIVNEILKKHTQAFRTGKTLPLEFRSQQIRGISKMIQENMDEMIKALRKDFLKPISEVLTELNYTISRAEYCLANLPNWMKGEALSSDALNIHNRLSVFPEPYGNVLILAPWNFPIILTLEPLIGAIAAGNTAVLKTSESVPHFSSKLKELLERYLDQDILTVLTEPNIGEYLTCAKFDFIFYTGSTKVGRLVMESASKNLIPMVLELGGQCPCYVHNDADVSRASRKIGWCRTINAGQLCVSVDYVLCHKDVVNALLEGIVEAWKSFYTEDMKSSTDFGRLISRAHTERVHSLIQNCSDEMIFGGDVSVTDQYIQPTLFRCRDRDSLLLKQEVFGPLLGVLSVENEDEAIEIIRNKSKPLEIYLFTYSDSVFQKFKMSTSSGGLVRNEVYLQMGVHNLPFGGVGESGMGVYHGHHTFASFSHNKSILQQSFSVSQIDNMTMPPSNVNKEWWMGRLIRFNYGLPCTIL